MRQNTGYFFSIPVGEFRMDFMGQETSLPVAPDPESEENGLSLLANTSGGLSPMKGEEYDAQDTQETEKPISPSDYPDRIDPGS
jgi:hypothetical protein